ncbi:reverse transcriptase family protein [Sphingomonas sp. SAFR-052]|uniref:reverse transcriptase family protein n=1 Tax=Sphingomonas sp. SAFR-052 TaxID=3436867 RepID=UPI003F7DFBBE
MAIKPEPNYRTFEIRKSSGAFRKIEAPRVFLKTVQRFIADYVLRDLPVHDAVHSFRRSRSSVTNAHVHRGSHWVGTIDIEDFFPSINEEAVQRLLMTNGFSVREATTIKRLCTYLGSLPQGGPASPVISNAVLYESDVICASIAEGNGLKYSRYADDLTFSGDNKHQVTSAIDAAKTILNSKYGMRINEKKSRINGPSSRRAITGATISDSVLPPREIRRNIRAACYNLLKSDKVDIVKLREVQGYLSYFESFPDFRMRSEYSKMREKLIVAKAKSRQIG